MPRSGWSSDKFRKPVFSFAERWRKKLVSLNEVGGPEGDRSRVGLRLLLPLGDAGARAVGREHQPVGLGGADGLCRPYGRSVQNGAASHQSQIVPAVPRSISAKVSLELPWLYRSSAVSRMAASEAIVPLTFDPLIPAS